MELLHAAAIDTAALLLSLRAGAPIAALAALAAAMAVDAAAPILRALLERGRLGEAEARLDTLFDAAQAGGGVPLSAAPAIRFAAPAPCHVAPDERLALSGPVRHRQDHAGRDAARPARGGAGPDRDRRA
jgi:ATP-binding cassette subfamily C protein CydC